MNASKEESAHKEVHERIKILSLSIAFDVYIFLKIKHTYSGTQCMVHTRSCATTGSNLIIFQPI